LAETRAAAAAAAAAAEATAAINDADRSIGPQGAPAQLGSARLSWTPLGLGWADEVSCRVQLKIALTLAR